MRGGGGNPSLNSGVESGNQQDSSVAAEPQKGSSASHAAAGSAQTSGNGSQLSGSGSLQSANGLPTAQPNGVSPQGVCNQTLDGVGHVVDQRWTVGSDTLVWDIDQEASTGECVLDLKVARSRVIELWIFARSTYPIHFDTVVYGPVGNKTRGLRLGQRSTLLEAVLWSFEPDICRRR